MRVVKQETGLHFPVFGDFATFINLTTYKYEAEILFIRAPAYASVFGVMALAQTFTLSGTIYDLQRRVRALIWGATIICL